MVERRHTAPDALDDFPTPPWATRALLSHVHPDMGGTLAWEPACGRRIMSDVLQERFKAVRASDVHDYGQGAEVGSFLDGGLGVGIAAPWNTPPDWIITNPPFRLATEFALRAFDVAPDAGVALLVRTSWLESASRFWQLFQRMPPSTIAIFCERVPMVQGRWDPEASTATSYSWVVWTPPKENAHPLRTRFIWIPPGQRAALTEPNDLARFAGR